MTVDITVTRDPPKERCRLCGLTLNPSKQYAKISQRYAEMFLILYDTPEKVLSKHEGIKICEECHTKLLLEAGFLT
jgi:hypothetical protein